MKKTTPSRAPDDDVKRSDLALRAMARVILAEFDQFEHSCSRKPDRSLILNVSTETAIARAVQAEATNRAALASAPFMLYQRALVGGQPTIFLFCRHSIPDNEPATPNCEFVSYLSPKGSLAARRVGDALSLTVPAGRLQVSIVERNEFTCRRTVNWDAVNNTYAALPDVAARIASLRDLDTGASEYEFEPSAREAEETELRTLERKLDALNRLSAQEREKIERNRAALLRDAQGIMEAFALRDRAVLDSVQDQVFRHELGSRLLVIGAPGTGKTTVLIKRIAQKTRKTFLSNEEIEGRTPAQLGQLFAADRLWVLFTPNDVLRHYIKEALGREGLAATERTVRTWSDQQRKLARDVFPVLKVGSRGRFTRTSAKLVHLDDVVAFKPYLDEFRSFWQRHVENAFSRRWSPIAAALQMDSESLRPAFGERGRSTSPFGQVLESMQALFRLVGGLHSGGGSPVWSMIPRIAAHRDSYLAATRALNAFFDQATTEVGLKYSILLSRVRKDESLEEATARLRRGLRSGAGSDPSPKRTVTGALRHSDESSDPIEAIADPILRNRILAARAWDRALRSLDELADGYDLLFRDTVEGYEAFRRSLQQGDSGGGSHLTEAGKASASSRLISDPEIDLLLFVLLRIADRAFSQDSRTLWNDAGGRVVQRLREEVRTVVTVDEAQDFSAVQLGCMYYLSHPVLRSFSMSGDLMQRVTGSGLRRWADCELFARDVSKHELRNAYRQNRTLLRIASRLYVSSMGEPPPFESPLPLRREPRPLLAIHSDAAIEAQWIAARITEIYQICDHRLPSIGVFVMEEDRVTKTADLLRDALAEDSIEVEACPGGATLGTQDRVRVFSIAHVKGLEFHGVFFLALDDLQGVDASLADKFLYVGLTRAAEFLAVTVRRELPGPVRVIEQEFARETWSDFVLTDEAEKSRA